MKNILVLDENKFILEALSGALCRYLKTCNVLTASNSAKGADILRTTPIDLILTDLDIPLADGYRFVEDARSFYPAIPLCVMTGDCSLHVKERLLSMGIRSIIEKPFQEEELARLVSDELKLHQDASPQNEAGHV